jgi:divalent metal cation (Fe/Co/Zn/Cd) transporter
MTWLLRKLAEAMVIVLMGSLLLLKSFRRWVEDLMGFGTAPQLARAWLLLLAILLVVLVVVNGIWGLPL